MLKECGAKRIFGTSDLSESFLLVTGVVHDFWQNDFAVLYDTSSNALVLLVSEDQFGLSEMFEIKKRLLFLAERDNNIKNIEVALADKAVIADLYKNKSSSVFEFANEVLETKPFIDRMISDAITFGASDIHIESKGIDSEAYIFFRTHGKRSLWRKISSRSALEIGSIFYEQGKETNDRLKYFDKDFEFWRKEGALYDYATQWKLQGADGRSVSIRFSFVANNFLDGFNISIRIFCDSTLSCDSLDIKKLGYSSEQIKMLDVMISGSSGLVLVCGPISSGKSMTLQSLSKRIYERRGDTAKIVAVQNRDEYPMPMNLMSFLNINCYLGSADHYSKLLRATFYQDPDVVIASNINDAESALAIKDLVLSGRKVVASFYSHSALWSFVRLREIGISWDVITMPGFVSGIIYQRLLPVLCPHCSIPITQAVNRVPHDIMHRVQQITDLMYDNVRVRGDGCTLCHDTGYFGQTICAELVLPDRMLLMKLAENNFIGAEKYWRDSAVGGRETSGVTILAHALYKMKKGVLSPLDIEENISVLTMDIVNTDNMISSSELSMLAGH